MQRHMRYVLATMLLLCSAGNALAQTAPDRIAGKCLLSIYIGFQVARPHCGTSSPELDAAIDEAVPILEKRLIEAGEVSVEQVQYERDANLAMWQEGGTLASQTEAACQSSDPVRWGMTPQSIRDTVRVIQSATPEMFSDECI
jgi:hypothetical protein